MILLVVGHLDQADEAVITKVAQRHLLFRKRDFLIYLYPNIMIVKYGGPHFSSDTANHIIEFVNQNQFWLIAECHAIANEGEFPTHKPLTKDFLNAHLNFIKENENVWVDTFSHIGLYLKQRKFVQIQVHEKRANKIVFSLIHTDPRQLLPIALTVVVPQPSASIQKVIAYRHSQNKTSVPVETKQDKWLMNVVPDGIPIVLEWE